MLSSRACAPTERRRRSRPVRFSTARATRPDARSSPETGNARRARATARALIPGKRLRRLGRRDGGRSGSSGIGGSGLRLLGRAHHRFGRCLVPADKPQRAAASRTILASPRESVEPSSPNAPRRTHSSSERSFQPRAKSSRSTLTSSCVPFFPMAPTSRRALIIASGARYRSLMLERWDEFVGAGIFYAATELEARFCADGPVTVVALPRILRLRRNGRDQTPGGRERYVALPARSAVRQPESVSPVAQRSRTSTARKGAVGVPVLTRSRRVRRS